MADETNPNPPQDEAGQVGLDQAELDSLLKGATGGQVAAAESAPASDTSEINQTDIDALVGMSSADAGASGSFAPSAALDAQNSSFDETAAAMQSGLEDDLSNAAMDAPTFQTKPFDLPELAAAIGGDVDSRRVSMLHDVNLRVRVELGRTKMLVEEVLKLGEGSIVELQKLAGDPVDVYVNDRLLARGEVLVLNDSFCVRVSEVFTPDPHRVLT